MPLRCPPPGPAHLVDLPARRLAGRTLWRVFQAPSRPAVVLRLAPPPRSIDVRALRSARAPGCLLPRDDQDRGGAGGPAGLRVRAAARLRVAPPGGGTHRRAVHRHARAYLTAAATRGVGVTAALWAGADRVCTQAWAYQLHRAGWLATYHGISHDPAGRLRAVTLFDGTGAHVPYDDPAWDGEHERLDDAGVRAGLARYGITVTRSDPELPLVDLDDTGLLEDTDR